jgi:hypothetical protein
MDITKYIRWQLADKTPEYPVVFIAGCTVCSICGQLVMKGQAGGALHRLPASFIVYHDACKLSCEEAIEKEQGAIVKAFVDRLIAVAPLWRAVLCRDVITQIVGHLAGRGTLREQAMHSLGKTDASTSC